MVAGEAEIAEIELNQSYIAPLCSPIGKYIARWRIRSVKHAYDFDAEPSPRGASGRLIQAPEAGAGQKTFPMSVCDDGNVGIGHHAVQERNDG